QIGGGVLTLSGANTFTGPVSIGSGATLTVSAGNNLGAAPPAATPSKIVINDTGTLRATSRFSLNTNPGITIRNSGGNGTGTINVFSDSFPAAGAAPTIQNVVYGGVIANNGTGADGLAKIGFGNLTLFGTNTYTGPTSVKNGTLTLDFSQS